MWNTCIHSTRNRHLIFSSAIPVMQVIFWTEDFCYISDIKNSVKCKLKKLIKEQIVVFYSPSNALLSSDEST